MMLIIVRSAPFGFRREGLLSALVALLLLEKGLTGLDPRW